MFRKIFLYLKKIDWILFLSILLLVSFGLAEIYSISLGRGSFDLLNFKKQVFFVIIGMILLFIFVFLDYNLFSNFSLYLYLLGVLSLIAVLVFGVSIRGTRGWFYFGNFGIQPVEFIKIILIIFLARFFSLSPIKLRPVKNLILSALASFVFIFLVLLQPDFGSALVLLALWLFMIFLAGVKKKYFFIIGLIFMVVLTVSWFFLFKDYQKQRIITFFQPSFNPLSEGYNISQAIIAVGSGGFAGRGIGFGSQSQLKFLPEAQNDFIFAVIAEELGFLGVFLVILFFIIFFYRCLVNLKNINNDFGIFFILASLGLIFIEMFINMGMNIGILPVVGISLPFLSYGGSSLLSHLILVGIIENIIVKSKIKY